MCLVSYLPLNSGFVLTSNRDENPLRTAQKIQGEIKNRRLVKYPVDSKGGTWIFATDRREVACVLNGAFIKHKHTPPYRLSRGQMMKDSLNYEDPVDFIENYSFQGIEPFTMIVKTPDYFLEFRWDGKLKHISNLHRDNSYVWSSCTLYTEKVQKQRENWFIAELGQRKISAESILQVHSTGGKEDTENGFIMNRQDIVRTISITQVIYTESKVKLNHNDLLNGQVLREEIELRYNQL